MKEEKYNEWQEEGYYYEKAKTEDDLIKEIESLKSQLADKDKEIASLSLDINMLDRGLHEHKSIHEQNWTKIFNQLSKENADLKSQLANIKYLNADEVENLVNKKLKLHFIDNPAQDSMRMTKSGGWTNLNLDENNFLISRDNINFLVQAICKLAIPDIDRDKIIKILHEFVVYQIEADNLIHNEAVEYVADEIIKAIRSKE